MYQFELWGQIEVPVVMHATENNNPRADQVEQFLQQVPIAWVRA